MYTFFSYNYFSNISIVFYRSLVLSVFYQSCSFNEPTTFFNLFTSSLSSAWELFRISCISLFSRRISLSFYQIAFIYYSSTFLFYSVFSLFNSRSLFIYSCKFLIYSFNLFSTIYDSLCNFYMIFLSFLNSSSQNFTFVCFSSTSLSNDLLVSTIEFRSFQSLSFKSFYRFARVSFNLNIYTFRVLILNQYYFLFSYQR